MQISVRNLSTRKLTSRMEFSALDVGVSTTLPMDLSLCLFRYKYSYLKYFSMRFD